MGLFGRKVNVQIFFKKNKIISLLLGILQVSLVLSSGEGGSLHQNFEFVGPGSGALIIGWGLIDQIVNLVKK